MRTAAPSTVNGEDTITIVAVHGVGNSFGAEISSEQKEELRAIRAASWTRHLAEGLGVPSDHIHLDFAYYADKLLPGIVEQGTAALDELDDPLEQQMLAAWAAHLGVPPEIAQGRLTAPLRQITAWVADRFDLAEGPLKVFIRLLFREVAAYLREHNSPHRLAARDEVAARIAQEQPRIVIAHSLGSVVAYEALHSHPELRPELFLTLGSPLALPRAVFHRLSPTPAGPGPNPQGQRPPGVSRWINIADPGDPVAIPPHLARYFKGITKDHTAAIARYDFHQAKNYLRSAATAATINPYLTTRGSRS